MERKLSDLFNVKILKDMKRIMAVCLAGLLCPTMAVKAQWVTFDPSNLAQSIVNTTRNVVQTTTTAENMVKNFQETVKIYEQGKRYYDALKAVNNLVKDARKVQQTVLLVGEISDIYVNSFQKMLTDGTIRRTSFRQSPPDMRRCWKKAVVC